MTKIRGRFIQKKVLDFYRALGPNFASLPFNIMQSIETLQNVRIVTYRDFANMHSIPLRDVIKYTESDDGSTHYNKNTNQYIILYNDETNFGRQRFTMAHELGHILLGHLTTLSTYKAASNNVFGISDASIERESDWFASMLLCPFPVLRKLKVNSCAQIQEICDISAQASRIKYEQYIRWCRHHRKTAWENDIVNLFLNYIKNN